MSHQLHEVMATLQGKGKSTWLDRALAVGFACAGALAVVLFLPGLVLWAATGNEEAGRSLARTLVGWGFAPLTLLVGLFWFAVPFLGSSLPSTGTRWICVGTGACLWGLGAGLSPWLLGQPELLAVRLGLVAGLLGLIAGWISNRLLLRRVLAASANRRGALEYAPPPLRARDETRDGSAS